MASPSEGREEVEERREVAGGGGGEGNWGNGGWCREEGDMVEDGDGNGEAVTAALAEGVGEQADGGVGNMVSPGERWEEVEERREAVEEGGGEGNRGSSRRHREGEGEGDRVEDGNREGEAVTAAPQWWKKQWKWWGWERRAWVFGCIDDEGEGGHEIGLGNGKWDGGHRMLASLVGLWPSSHRIVPCGSRVTLAMGGGGGGEKGGSRRRWRRGGRWWEEVEERGTGTAVGGAGRGIGSRMAMGRERRQPLLRGRGQWQRRRKKRRKRWGGRGGWVFGRAGGEGGGGEGHELRRGGFGGGRCC